MGTVRRLPSVLKQRTFFKIVAEYLPGVNRLSHLNERIWNIRQKRQDPRLIYVHTFNKYS